MPVIKRQQCGCTCRNQTGYDPVGDPMLPCACTECDYLPCEYIALFGCDVTCDGLRTGRYGCVPLIKDDCLFEDSCRWTHKKSWDGPDCDRDDAADAVIYTRQTAGGCDGPCNHVDPPGTAPQFSQLFPGVAPDAGGTLIYDAPVFGCRSWFSGGPGHIDVSCGWYDLYRANCCDGMETDLGTTDEALLTCGEYIDNLENCWRNDWVLEISGTDATLTGTTDSEVEIVYTTDAWECSTADDGKRITFTIQDYEDQPCPGLFPKKICVVPGLTDWATFCDSGETACACYDAGWEYLPFGVTLPGCPEQTTCLARDIAGDGTPTVPACGSYPTAPCGVFHGQIVFSGSGGTQRCLSIYSWCDGADWNLRLCCGSGSPCGSYTAVCETTWTETSHCPVGFRGTFECEDFGDCTCDVTVCSCTLPATLVATVTSSCATLNGDTITLEWDGTDSWDGTWTASGSCEYDVTLVIEDAGGGSCIAEIIATGPDGQCLQIQSVPFVPTEANCENITLDDSGQWNGGSTTNCCCATTDTITINVTP